MLLKNNLVFGRVRLNCGYLINCFAKDLIFLFQNSQCNLFTHYSIHFLIYKIVIKYVFRIRSTDDGKKRGASILFNSLQFPSDEIKISKPIAINNVKDEQITLKDVSFML